LKVFKKAVAIRVLCGPG